MPHFKEFLDPNFLSNIDFIDDKMKYVKKMVTLTDVKKETAHNGKDGKESTVTTLHFKECKPMILSPKNFKTILQMTRKINTDDWMGMQLELYILENQKAFGSVWDVIRVSSAKVSPPSKPVDYSKQTQELKSCQTIETLQATFLALDKPTQLALASVTQELKTKLSNRDELQMTAQ